MFSVYEVKYVYFFYLKLITLLLSNDPGDYRKILHSILIKTH